MTSRLVRALAVTVGPAVALDLAVAAGALSAARSLSRRSRPEAHACWATAGLAAYLLARARLLRWGATREEAEEPLPGDEAVPEKAWQSTRAVTIEAPPDAVWPWLVQIGHGRGGFYSYDLLEDLAGLEMASADRILPAHQDLRPGDVVRYGPREFGPGAGWRVVEADRPCTLVLEGWSFVLRPLGERRTRLLVRTRVPGRPRSAMALAYALAVEIPHFVMERKMLLGIKERAESSAPGRAQDRELVRDLQVAGAEPVDGGGSAALPA